MAIFREALPADAHSIASIYLKSRKTFLPYAPLRHTDEEIFSWVADILIPTKQVTLAKSDSQVLGMMALHDDGDFGWIDHLYLDPSAVNQGIGAQFIAHAKSILRGPIRLYTFQENLDARRFYERHGFQVIALSDGSSNEEQCPDVLYEFSH